MKVAMIANSNHNMNSGVSGTRLAIAESLRHLGVHVDTYFMDDFKVFNGGILDKIIFPWKLASKLSSWKDYDLLDIASGDSWVLSYFKKRPAIVSSSHGLEHLAHKEILEENRLGHLPLSKKYFVYWGGYRIWEVSQSFKRSDFSIVLNSEDKDFVKDHLGKEMLKISAIFNGIPSYLLNLHLEDLDTENVSTIRIAQVGSYIHRKGITYSTQALNAILEKFPHVEVAFMGTGCEKEKVLSDFNPKVKERVAVIPSYQHSELPRMLKGYHIKLFPTLSEGFGKTLVECMACGLAPITTDTAGPADIVTDGEDALVIPKRNVDKMVQALVSLIEDPVLLRQIRHNAYRRAQSFTWDNAARNRLDCYKRAIQYLRS
ncbi:glycosyltransferase family 4 protein [Paenibacillus lautus]|uniref:Glycosyltransferase n=1 Tax=Paenibacillus lautus TaxID=1401 RepID=A0A385TR50_PAELA|nr:glycosyltransferase family 4 protein [Paenibacillus lautus]AYB46920.1 glycosyltransferase [Paenibacillus lautus]